MASPLRRLVLHLIVIGGAVIFLFPLFWMVSTSLKPADQVMVWPPSLFPVPPKFANYVDGWNSATFSLYYRNTILITGTSILGTVLSSSLVAYGFARLRFVGRDVLFLLLLATMMLPGQVTMIPIYILFARLGWINTFLPLIVPSFFGSAFNVFLLRQFFLGIPRELDDAARIDGCSQLGIYWRIILPLSTAALAVVAIFAFTYNWNDFLMPLLYLESGYLQTITLGLASMQAQASFQFPSLMAMTTVALIPQIVIFFLAQRQFIQGIVMTGIKG
jgi:ABC-type glycerol-3-phosphate transport system permease component